jgi:RNA polymerase sigma-70 factor (ECF subfamily)
MARDPFAEKSDEELMTIYQSGTLEAERAFDILFDRHSRKVLGFLMKKLTPKQHDQTVANDLVQEVFLKLHRSRAQYDPRLAFAPWLFSITRSVQLDYLKKNRPEEATDHETLESIAGATTFSRVPETSEEPSAKTQEALAALPSAQREAVALRVYDEATFEEIAAKLSVTPANARQLVSRGIRKLKNALMPGKE